MTTAGRAAGAEVRLAGIGKRYGTVAAVNCRVGQTVERNAVVVSVMPE